MAAAGVPYASALVYVAAIAEIIGGLMVMTGFLTRPGAVLLVLYLVPVTIIMHGFWNAAGQERTMQFVQFMKNLSIIGGLLMIVAFGPGKWSVDWKLRRPKEP